MKNAKKLPRNSSKKRYEIAVLVIIIMVSVPIVTLVKLNIINIEPIFKYCNFFSQYITHRGDLDDEWDFQKIVMPNKNGYYDWRIGLKDNKMSAVRGASDSTVVLVGSEKLDMDFKSKRDYYEHNGPNLFRAFIDENSR